MGSTTPVVGRGGLGARARTPLLAWGAPRPLAALIVVAALLGAPRAAAQTPGEAPADDAPPKAQAAPESLRLPGRRRAIGGLAGFVSRSKLVYPALPDTPFQLEATYLFPERARWLIQPWPKPGPDGGAPQPSDRRQRTLRFQFGAGAWALEAGEPTSRLFIDEELRLTRLQLELRRVAMTWPAEHEWVAAGDTLRVSLEGLGVLVAILGEDGRPRELASQDEDGTKRERLAELRWSEPAAEGARVWPAGWDFHYGDALVWHETIESVTMPGKISELYFLPPDRRGPGARVSLPPGALQRVDLPAVAAWSEELGEAARDDWPLALAAARAALARWEATLGSEVVAERPAFHLDATGRPVRLELRLRSVPETLPEGWRTAAAGPAIRRILAGLDGVDAAAIRALGEELAPTERPGTAHLVVQLVGDGAGLTQLIVPARKTP